MLILQNTISFDIYRSVSKKVVKYYFDSIQLLFASKSASFNCFQLYTVIFMCDFIASKPYSATERNFLLLLAKVLIIKFTNLKLQSSCKDHFLVFWFSRCFSTFLVQHYFVCQFFVRKNNWNIYSKFSRQFDKHSKQDFKFDIGIICSVQFSPKNAVNCKLHFNFRLRIKNEFKDFILNISVFFEFQVPS